jgi:1,4-dihydroxy-2-naphthoate octaprenyltransferase
MVLIVLSLLSAFFSKYYTAAPVKLAYRGWGEFFVWLAFGPMAISVAVISQNVSFNDLVFLTMPITGISTLSILLVGEIIDFDADKVAGKWGVAVRRGKRFTGILYFLVQAVLCANIVVLSLTLGPGGWIVLLSLVPYVFLWPAILKILLFSYDEIERLKKAARQNVSLHLIFSLLFTVSLLAIVLSI